MTDNPGPRPRFALTFRGYDRDEVDSWLTSHESEVSQAHELAQATRRAEALEARLSELGRNASLSALPDSLTSFVLGRTHQVADELPDQVVREAEADREAAQKATREAMGSAQERSAQILNEAKRDQEKIALMVDEARKQLDLFVDQTDDMARDRVRRQWTRTTGPLTELELELAQLRARRVALLSELADLEESLEASRALHRERIAAGTAGRDAPPIQATG